MYNKIEIKQKEKAKAEFTENNKNEKRKNRKSSTWKETRNMHSTQKE